MSNKKRKAKSVTKNDEYLKLFPEDQRNENEKIRYTALKEAQEIRKFEIDLYWRRTGFFWAFITIIYTALFATLCKYIENTNYSFLAPVISTLSGLGFFFSVAWHMINKGSKFWQINWETHVSLLEKTEIGPLYDTYLNPKKTGSRLNPTKEYDYSVTKINMWASFTILICSLCGFLGTIIWLLYCKKESLLFVLIPAAIISIFTILLIFLSNGNSDIELTESESNDLTMIQIL